MNQARVVDINVYYRTGGVSRDKVVSNNDACILQAGVSRQKNHILEEQRALLEGHLPLAYYHVISDYVGGKTQANDMLNWVGSNETIIIDVEQLHGRVARLSHIVEYANRITQVTGRIPWLYSRRNVLEYVADLGSFSMFEYIWGAAYPYVPGTTLEYRYYEPFLQRFDGEKPYTFVGTPLESRVILWQFTKTGDALKYAANKHTDDENYPVGMTRCDLSVSTIEKQEFIDIIKGTSKPPVPPPEPPQETHIIVDAYSLRMRSEPSTASSATIVGKTWRGKRLEVIKQEGSWYKVAVYVHGDYVHED